MGILIDLVLLGFLICQTYMGWRSGFLWQVAGVASVGFGLIVGSAVAPSLGGKLLGVVTSNPFHARLIAFLLAAGLVCLAFRLVGVYAETRADEGISKKERENRRREDRVLGSIFGALKGLVLTLVLLAGAVGLVPERGFWGESRLAGPLATAGLRILPERTGACVQNWLERSGSDLRVGLQLDDKDGGRPSVRRRAMSESR